MTDVVMPQMGESIVEGTLTRWLKKPGERVERDEPLFEISTDKVDTEIPSPAEGVLSEVLVQEGATVAINSVVARIGDGNGAGAAAPTAAAQQEARPSAAPPASVDVGPSAAASEVKAAPPPPASAPSPPPPAQVAPQTAPAPSARQTANQAAQQATRQETQPPRPQAAPPQPAPVPQPDGADRGPLSTRVRKMAREYNIDLAQV